MSVLQAVKFNEFAKVAIRYVNDAVERIELLAAVPEYGRRRALTFAQMKVEDGLFPRPKAIARQ